ncbi:hypothetical protein HGRIS_007649 [Hohenbuehelia grisea]|uniref:Copper acquisition factor BIM1-like domain-containing protein n=1 Tax=Hohenbuehelia grisea TaxID=104357 RepID=A0ABR3J6W3_9AGAR
MLFTVALFVATLFGMVNAHFRLLYPEPRGVFVADQEPNFCGGYQNAVSNRSTFPLSGGSFKIRQGHPSWSVAVWISTAQNPNSFDNFSSNGQPQYARQFAKEESAGIFCIPLDLSNTGISGVRDGANVTIQVAVAGTDGNLYQCADLTLSSNFTIPDNVTCTNETATASGAHGQPSATSPAASGNGALGSTAVGGGILAVVLGAAGLALSLL